MENLEKMVTVRHLEDVDNLKEFGLNSSLREGQEELVEKTAEELINLAKKEGATYIDIFASDQKRTSETAVALQKSINDKAPDFSEITVDHRLNDLNQGTLNLPEGYLEGEVFQPLREAWKVFWDETFVKGDMLYRFGSPVSSDGSRNFSKLEGGFLEYGECYAQMAERLYDFIYSLLNQENEIPVKRLLGLVGHSITFGIMHELAVISKDYMSRPMKPIPFGELPKITWEYFAKLKDSVLKENPKYGEIALFDITHLKDEVFLEHVAIERDALRALLKQSNVQN